MNALEPEQLVCGEQTEPGHQCARTDEHTMHRCQHGDCEWGYHTFDENGQIRR